MAAYKHIDKICCAMLAVVLVVTVVFLQGERIGITAASHTMGYEDRLFDTSRVHTLDITMEDWDGFLETCTNEEYSSCTVTIDQEEYANVAIRAKGNTSLQNVAASGGDRYSFKIEFDHYDDSITYHGLDKLCLNNIIQDNTYLKDYLCYRMMAEAGAAAPLCSFAYITVNGEDWGLYLAVEAVEESFLERNYGSDYGELYKPDTTQMGGGPKEQQTEDSSDSADQREQMQPPALPQEEAVIGESGSDPGQMLQRPEGGGMGGGRGGMDRAFPGQRNQETTSDTSGEAETASPPAESTDAVSENSSVQTQQRPGGMRNPDAETTDSTSADHFAAEGQQPSGEAQDFAQPPELPFGEVPGEGTEGAAAAVSSQTDDSVAEGGSAQPDTEAQNFTQPPELPFGEMPEQGSETESATASADSSGEQPAEESAQSASGAGETEDSRFSRGNGGMPPWGQSAVEETASTGTIVALLGGSVLVLAVGLGIAWRFRR